MTQYEDIVEKARLAEKNRKEGWNFKYREYNHPTVKYGFKNEVEVVIHLDSQPNEILVPHGSSRYTRQEASNFLKEELRLRKMAEA